MKKTIMDMIKEITSTGVSVDEIANHIGLNESQFHNRLYQSKGQRFTEEELIAIQERYEVHHYTAEVCRKSGGVFIKTPDAEELDSVELSVIQINEQSKRGTLFEMLKTSLADGVIDEKEAMALRKILNHCLSATVTEIESFIALYTRK